MPPPNPFMFFSCKVCSEKDKRIDDLKGLLKIFTASTQADPEQTALEADALMSGHQEVIEITSESEDAEEEALEADRIFSGTY